MPSLKGKRVAVTGSTGGIGRELCTHLARLGASLVLLDRNIEKSRALGKELEKTFCGIKIEYVTVDMEDMAAVKRAAELLLENVPDYLVLNAGAYHIPRHKCSTGYDNVYQINFVSPYFLARTLAPKIRERGGKIVALGSIAHNYSHIDENDIDFSTRKKSSKVYGNAKRYFMYSLWALESKAISVVHPGITLTNITAHYPPLVFAIIKYPMKIIFMKPARAALCVLAGMINNCGEREWIGPRVFDIWGLPKVSVLRTCGESERAFINKTAEKIYEQIKGEDYEL